MNGKSSSSHRRGHVIPYRLAPLLILVLLVSGCQLTDDAQKAVKDRFRLSVMTLNIGGASPSTAATLRSNWLGAIATLGLPTDYGRMASRQT